MSDEFTHVDKIAISLSTVAGFAVTVAGALWKRNENRADRHEKRIAQLEADIQRRVDFKHHAESIEAMRQESREDQNANTERIMQSINAVNAQISAMSTQLIDVYKILINNSNKQG